MLLHPWRVRLARLKEASGGERYARAILPKAMSHVHPRGRHLAILSLTRKVGGGLSAIGKLTSGLPVIHELRPHSWTD
jgi:hypothetical protein